LVQTPFHLLLADDHFVVRGGLELIIKAYYADAKIFFASNFKEIFKNLEQQSFAMIVLDASFPEGNSLSIIEKILAVQPDIKILMYTALEENIFASKFFGLGVKGFLSKMADEEEIISAIRKVLNGEIYLSKLLKETMLDGLLNKSQANPFEKLSPREFEIMMLMAEGEANLEISNKLEIKPSTISTYKSRIFEKLDIANISELIALYKLYQD